METRLSGELPAARPSDQDVRANPYRWVVHAASGGALLATALVAVVATYEISQGTSLSSLVALGYPGVFLAMFFSSATVLLPAPGLLAVLAAGSVQQFNPWVLGMFAGFGSAAGELTGYLVGFGGRQVLRPSENPWVRRCEYLMRRWGFLTILVLAAIPNPFFDVAGIIAGGLGYPTRRFFAACIVGKSIKCIAFAVFGEVLARFLGGLFPGLLPLLFSA